MEPSGRGIGGGFGGMLVVKDAWAVGEWVVMKRLVWRRVLGGTWAEVILFGGAFCVGKCSVRKAVTDLQGGCVGRFWLKDKEMITSEFLASHMHFYCLPTSLLYRCHPVLDFGKICRCIRVSAQMLSRLLYTVCVMYIALM